MKNWARLATVLFLFPLLLVLAPRGVSAAASAITLSPNSGLQAMNSTTNLAVIANPVNGETLVRLDLHFTNATVLGFTPASMFVTSLGECAGGATFTTDNVCVSMANSTSIPSGSNVGTISVRWGSSGTATVMAGADNSFVIGTTVNTDSGLKATFNLNNIPGTALISIEYDKYLWIIAGIGTIACAIYLRKRTQAAQYK